MSLMRPRIIFILSLVYITLFSLPITSTAQTMGTISGYVYDESNNPLQGIRIQVLGEDGYQGDVGCSGVDGSYSGSIPLNISYRVFAGGQHGSCGNATTYAFEFWNETFDANNAPRLLPTTQTPDFTQIDFTLELGGTVTGVVVDSQTNNFLNNLAVVVEFGFLNWGMGECTDGVTGIYEVGGLPFDLPFKVSAATSDRCGNLDPYIQETYDNSYDYEQGITLITTESNPIQNSIDFSLQLGGTITGQLFESDGSTPIVSSWMNVVLLDADTEEWLQHKSPDNGTTYSFSGLTDGNYVLFAQANGYAWEYYSDTRDFAQAQVITINNGSTYTADFSFEPGGTIAGQVTNEQGNPLQNLSIVAELPRSGIDTCSDENGDYAIEFLPLNESYTIRAGDIGYCQGESPGTFVLEWWNNVHTEETATPILVSSAQPMQTGYDFVMEMGGSISGRITDVLNNGVDGVEVVARDPDGGDWIKRGTIDSNGDYIISGLSTGDYHVYVEGDGYANEYYQDLPLYLGLNPDDPDLVSVVNGNNTPNIDFSLEDGGSVTVTVIADNTGLPISGVPVDTEPGGFGECTNENGQATLRYLPTNTNIYVRAGGSQGSGCDMLNLPFEYYDDTTEYNDRTPIIIPTKGGVENITISLGTGGSVSGFVYDSVGNPIENAQVIVETFDWQWIADNWTASDGSYTISGLSTGAYRVKVYADGYAHTLYDGHVAYPFDFNSATPVNVTSGNVTSPINFNLEAGGNIEVYVFEADGVTPIEGVPVDTYPGGFGRCTDSNGFAVMGNIPINTDIIIKAGGSQWGGCPTLDRDQQYSGGVADQNQAIPNVLTSGGETQTISFSLGTGGTVSGNIIDGDTGLPLENARVDIAILQDRGNGNFDYQTANNAVCTDQNGNYTLPLPKGTHKIVASASCNGQPPYYGDVFYPGTSYPNQAGDVVVSDPTPDVTDIDFILYPAGVVRGTVYDATTGNPIPDISVQFFFPFTGHAICTDENGDYEAIIGWHDVPFTASSPSTVSSEPGGSNICLNDANYLVEYWEETTQENNPFEFTSTPTNRVFDNINFTLEDDSDPRYLCYIVAPASIDENEAFTSSITCEEAYGVYGFDFAHSISPNPPITPQSTSYQSGDIFASSGSNTLTLINNLTDGYAQSLRSPETAVDVINPTILASVTYDTDLPGTLTLTIDKLLLGNELGHSITGTYIADTLVEIIDLPLAGISGTVTREAGLDKGANITMSIDAVPPPMTTINNGVLHYEYPEIVALTGLFEADAPGHLSCSQSLNLVDEIINLVAPTTLLAGDVNDDDEINITDGAIIVSARIGDPIDPTYITDLNEDGAINILDLIHVGRNFNNSNVTCFGQ